MAILLKGWFFPIGQSGEASPWRVCYQRGLPRLVFTKTLMSAEKEKLCITNLNPQSGKIK